MAASRASGRSRAAAMREAAGKPLPRFLIKKDTIKGLIFQGVNI